MEIHRNIGKSILKDFYDFSSEKSLDDAEYIPVVRVIIKGIVKNMAAENFNKNEIQSIEKDLKEFNRAFYVNGWLKNTKEDEGDIDEEEETESARYYFDYIYEHGEHPH